MGDIRSSATWVEYEPKRREGAMEKYKGRFMVVLSDSKKVFYLSDMILSHLLYPEYIKLRFKGTMIGIQVGTKMTGFKVSNKPGTTPHISVPGFLRQFREANKNMELEPGAYEAIVERMDAQTAEGFDLIIFDMTDRPSKIRANGNGHKKK